VGIRWTSPVVRARTAVYLVAAVLIGVFLPSLFPVAVDGAATALLFSVMIVGIDVVAKAVPGVLSPDARITDAERHDELLQEFGGGGDIDIQGLSTGQVFIVGAALVPLLAVVMMIAAFGSQLVAGSGAPN
jgi:hypothetical protein